MTNIKEKLLEFKEDLSLNEKSENTIKYYERAINLFIQHVGDNKLSKQIVIEFKNKLLNSNYEKSTVDRYIVAVNKFLKFCKLDDLKVKQLKLQTRLSYDKTVDEVDYKRLLRWSKKLELHDIYLVMKVLANTGIRVAALKYFKVEILDNSIEVFNKGKYRNIIIRQELIREIRKYCRENKIKSGYIFVKNGKPITNAYIWKKMQLIAGRAKVNKSKAHPHSLRHFFAKRFLENGNNPLELADILGHSSLETTRIYNRSNEKEKQKKIEKITYNC